VPVFAELEIVGNLEPTLDVLRITTGLAGGLHGPSGRITPLALVEVGAVTATQTGTNGRGARAVGTYRGAGLGAELWLDKYFVLADARFRRLSTGSWRTDDDAKLPLEVPHPDQHVTAIVARVAAGWRF
jgi:hypothetical protein